MYNSKIRKIASKKSVFLPIILLLIIAVTLAFIPHYTCACGEIKKVDGSMLKALVINPTKEAAEELRRIFK